jgi:hypothetical protein
MVTHCIPRNVSQGITTPYRVIDIITNTVRTLTTQNNRINYDPCPVRTGTT